MRKAKGFIVVTALIITIFTVTILGGCGSKNQAQSSSTASSTSNQTQGKPDIKTIVKDLVAAGTLKQDQADKIVADFEKSPNAGQEPNGLLESLVKDKTITEEQQHIIIDKMFGSKGKAGDTNIGGGQGMSNADTSSVKTKYLDIAYASKSSAQKLDIYLPNSGSGPFPVIISIHGGGFMMGDKADGQLTPMLKALDRGYAVVSINYRLSSEAQFPAAVNDVKAAIKYVRANASKYSMNPDKIATWGGSAGGNLAAIAGTSGDDKSLEDASLGNVNISSKVQAVVDWFGPIYFDQMDAQFTKNGVGAANHTAADSPESKYLGATGGLTTVPDLVKKANPAMYITNDDPAFFIEHGTKDGNVPTEQSINFATDLKKVLGDRKVTLTLLEKAGYGTSEFSTTENVNKVLDFLDKNLK